MDDTEVRRLCLELAVKNIGVHYELPTDVVVRAKTYYEFVKNLTADAKTG